MAKEVPSVSEDDFEEVVDLAEETPQVVIEEALDMIEAEEAEIFSAPEVEEDISADLEPEVEVLTPAANPARVRLDGGIVVARSRRKP